MATSELDIFLAASMEIKLLSLEQLGARDYIAGGLGVRYSLPYIIGPIHVKMSIELDSDLLFPMIDLFLGGSGQTTARARDLTGLDEELLESITSIFHRQI